MSSWAGLRRGGGDLDEGGEGGVGRRGFAPADHEATFGGGTFEGAENDLGRKVLGFGRRHESGAETGANESNGIGARPNLFGDARRETGAGKGGEDAVVVTGIVRARKDDEWRRGKIPKLKMRATGERMSGGKEDPVAFAEQEAGMKVRCRGVGVEKAAGEIAGFERGELGGRGRFVEFDANAREALVELAENARKDGGHGEAGEGDPDVSDLTGSERLEFGGNGHERTKEWFDAFEEKASRGRDFYPAAGAIEEVSAEGGFELGNRTAEGGLRDGEAFGGFAEVKLGGDFAKVDQVAEFER